jgi:hypothetical protein
VVCCEVTRHDCGRRRRVVRGGQARARAERPQLPLSHHPCFRSLSLRLFRSAAGPRWDGRARRAPRRLVDGWSGARRVLFLSVRENFCVSPVRVRARARALDLVGGAVLIIGCGCCLNGDGQVDGAFVWSSSHARRRELLPSPSASASASAIDRSIGGPSCAALLSALDGNHTLNGFASRTNHTR